MPPDMVGSDLGAPTDMATPAGSAQPVYAGFPIPDFITSSGSGPTVSLLPMYVPSDVTAVTLRFANRGAYGNAASPITSNIAAYTEDGAGGGTGTAAAVYNAQTVPSDGSELVLGSFPITRGTTGKILVAFSLPGTFGSFAQGLYNYLGKYATGTSTVSPLPSASGNSTIPIFTIHVQYSTTHRRIVVFGDSIGVGSTNASDPVTTGGFQVAAWNLMARDHDIGVDIEGVNGGQLVRLAQPSTYPYLWADAQVSGSEVVIELGTNDAQLTLTSMQSSLTTIVARLQTLGATRIYANTLAPAQAYSGSDSYRVAYNTWLLANYVSLGLHAVCDIDTLLRDPANHSQLLASYSSDGTHYTASAQLAVEHAWEPILGY